VFAFVVEMFLRRKVRLTSFAINNSIIFPRVRLLSAEGENLGLFATYHALEMAKARKTDLVLIKANPEPLCVLESAEKIRRHAEEVSNIYESRFTFDPCFKVKIIQFSPNVDVGDFQRKVEILRYFLQSRHRCEVKLTSASPRLLARILSEVRDVGAPPEEVDDNQVRIKLWPANPGETHWDYKIPNFPDESDASIYKRRLKPNGPIGKDNDPRNDRRSKVHLYEID
jgi:translation initiation factor IF-3